MMPRLLARGQFDVTTLSKLFVTLLFLVALGTAAPAILSGDFAELATSAGPVYVTGMLAVGVLRDATDERWWQVAFFGGLAGFGLIKYVRSGDLFDLLWVVVGGMMVVTVAYDRLSS